MVMAKTKAREGRDNVSGHQSKRGLWTTEEDRILKEYVMAHGQGRWNVIAKRTGLKRCGKSCRLRWMNYLRPDVKREDFTEQEDDLIIRLHKLLGNRWSLIAKRIPGRTDNQVKNYWNTHLSKKLGISKHEARGPNSSRAPEDTSEASSSVNSTNVCTTEPDEITEKAAEAAVETQQCDNNTNNNNNNIAGEYVEHPLVSGEINHSFRMINSFWDFDSITTLLRDYPNDDLSWLQYW